MHLVEQASLYRTTSANISVNSGRPMEFFKHGTLLCGPVDPIKVVKIVSIPIWSDTAFHEESEYVVCFKIRVKKGGLSSQFRKTLKFFSMKKPKVQFSYFTYIFATKRFH